MGLLDKLFSKKETVQTGIQICAPVTGTTMPLTQVPDPTFSEGSLGKGIAVMPAEGKVYAPCDASVDMMFPTGHAVNLFADCGAEVLVHLGLNTMGLGEACFKTYAQSGDRVKKGDLLIEMDLDKIKEAGLNPVTLVVVCNSGDFSAVIPAEEQEVSRGDTLLILEK